MKYCYTDFFADDAIFHTHNKYLEVIEKKLQSDADTIKDGSRPNKMHINYDKSNYMVLGTTHKLNTSHQFYLRIDNKPIKIHIIKNSLAYILMTSCLGVPI